MFACEHVTHSMGHMKTVGVIGRDDIEDMVEIAEPVGVVAAVTPVTNPTSTTIFKALLALKTRNPVVFAFHPSAQRCSAEAARVVRDAAVLAGAPEHCVQWIETPSVEATRTLMRHPGVSLILATGGNAMVKAAYSAGKPALGVGAGNVPAYVHRSAKQRRAVNDLVLSKAFDNGMICASEQAVILDTDIYAAALAEFRTLHAHLATPEEKAKLETFLFPATGGSGAGCEPKVNAAAVGQSPAWIAERAGFSVPENTSVILVEAERVGPDEPLTREKHCPVRDADVGRHPVVPWLGEPPGPAGLFGGESCVGATGVLAGADEFGQQPAFGRAVDDVQFGALPTRVLAHLVDEPRGQRLRQEGAVCGVPSAQSTVQTLLFGSGPGVGTPSDRGEVCGILRVGERVDDGPESEVQHGQPHVEQGGSAAEHEFSSVGVGEWKPATGVRVQFDLRVVLRDEAPGLGVHERRRGHSRTDEVGGRVSGACADDGHEGAALSTGSEFVGTGPLGGAAREAGWW